MKYVIFRTEGKGANIYKPVIIPEHVTHSTVKIDEHNGKERSPINQNKVFSAGFCWISGGKMVVDENRKSDSLGIGPKPETDSKILTAVLLNAGASFFIEYL